MNKFNKHQSIFISENFTSPLFNKAMEEQLKIISEWLKQEILIDKSIISGVCFIIDETIKLNQKLSADFDYESYLSTQAEEVNLNVADRNFATNQEFYDVNPSIKISDIANIAKSPYILEHSEVYIEFLHKKIRLYCEIIEDYDSYLNLMFISRFLGELIWNNHCIISM
jgi:hypothetical protein